jgi:O-antigen/teichoic acid export membrane protein
MAISIINIARNSLKFTSVNFLAALILMPVTIYAATILVPEEYGIYGFLGLWLTYAGLIGPGIVSAGQREIPVLLGRGKEREALEIQNISLSAEILYTIIPFVVILGASFFYSSTVLKLGLIIVAVSYVASRLAGFWNGMNFIREKFNVVVKGNLIVAILTPLAMLAGVNWLGVYALLIAPLIANVVVWVYYLKKGALNYHFKFDRSETVKLVKVGVVLQALTFVFWAFRLADRTIIAAMLPLEQLGLYVFAIQFIMIMERIPIDFTNVLQPILWREAGKADSIFEGFKDTRRIAVYLALGTAVLIPIAQLVFYLVVSLITTKYIGSIPIFYVLSYNLYLGSIVTIPNLILNSSIVNKQKITLYCYSIGLALNIIFDILVVKLGYGVVGVAWVTICTQGLVTFILYRFIRGYIFRDVKDFARFQLRISFPFLITIPFYFLHNYLNLVTSNLWTFAGISLATQVILWSLVIGIFYRDYLSISDIKALMREINAVLQIRK